MKIKTGYKLKRGASLKVKDRPSKNYHWTKLAKATNKIKIG